MSLFKRKRKTVFMSRRRRRVRRMNVARPLRRELKWVEYFNIATIAASATLVGALLNDPLQGVNESERIGRRIQMVRLDVKFIYMPNAASVLDQLLRTIILIDKQANGATPTTAMILANSSNASQTIVSHRYESNRNRFRFLYDQVHTSNFNGESIIRRRVSIPLSGPDSIVTFSTTNGGTVADINTNSMWMFFVTDQVANQPTFSLSSRLWFYDD